MFFGAESFWRLVRNYRHCWYRGRYGGGKTSLAVATALQLLDSKQAKACVSNIPTAFGEQSLPDLAENVVILMDEGGLFWKTGRAFELVAAYLRKQNIFVLIPSITPPSLQFRTLSVQRIFNVASVTGLNIWIYKWSIRAGGISEDGKFVWAFPKIFKWYDTNYAPTGDEGIPQWISQRYRKQETDGSGQDLLKSSEGEELREAAWTMQAAADSMEKAAKRTSQGRLF